MRDDAKRARQAEIAEAAYALVGEKGFGGTSMLAVAKRAKASNETLYRWYGDKIGLFTALIEDNAAGVQDLLEDALSKGSDPIETLAALGPRLFELLTSDRAIALNRAAAADGTGELGAALTRAGREKVMPLIAQVIALAEDAGALGGAQPGEAARLWLDLLVGDVQIRRAIGAVPVPDQAECERRGAMALHRLRLLLPPA